MTPQKFEEILDRVAELLTEDVRTSELYHGPEQFEQGALSMLRAVAKDHGVTVSPSFHPHAFPDIKVNGFGVEVKYTKHDTWEAVGNSVFEGQRDPAVSVIYVLFGKLGGAPEVRWRRYDDCIAHVRVSNSPRFVVDMEAEVQLFEQFPVTYDEFVRLKKEEKMQHIRSYWRGRLKPGERLWWLEPSHTLPIQVRLYMTLPQHEKRQLRAEAAILCPKICSGSRVRNKYIDAATYLLTYHGVFCPQARDLFSAGSVALRDDGARGGNYVLRALKDIENLMRDAAMRMDGALFKEYWGEDCPPKDRIAEWLSRADKCAQDWQPSAHLFLD